MDNIPIQFRFEEMLEKIRTDPVIAVLAIALNEVVTKQEEHDKVNALVHKVLQEHADQIQRLAESMNALSQGMIAITAAMQRTQMNHQTAPMGFRGITIK